MAKYVDYTFENCECQCDECGFETIIDSTDYSDINKQLKDDNWIIKKIGDYWHEFCSEECYEIFMNSEIIKKEGIKNDSKSKL